MDEVGCGHGWLGWWRWVGGGGEVITVALEGADSGKSYWNRGGVALENKDGSFTFKLDILPQTKFQLREEKPVVKEEAAAAE